MHQDGSCTGAVVSLQNPAQRALSALQARCAKLSILDPKFKCKLYDAVVRPVLSYSCEVWMPLISASGLRRSSQIFSAGSWAYHAQQAPQHSYAENGRLPDSSFWWQQSLGYMHHLTQLDDDHLVHRAFAADFVQDLGWGQAVRARLSPLWITLPHQPLSWLRSPGHGS